MSFHDYSVTIASLLGSIEATRPDGSSIPLEEALEAFIERIQTRKDALRHVFWVGNGGSAAIASHSANDYMKNGGCRSQAFHEAAAITCLSNDYGYPHVFEKQIERFADRGDLVVLISSSGKSENILLAAQAAKSAGCEVITFSGMAVDNPLRKLGDINFYTPNSEYGFVELSHQIFCHAALDIMMASGAASGAHSRKLQVVI